MSESTKVKSLSKAITILDVLSTESNGISLNRISEKTGYPKSTVHALLSTMRDRGVVKQNENGAYALGIKLFEYGCAVSRGMDITTVSRPYLEKLSSLTGANAVITMLDESGAVSFDYASSPSGVQIMPEIGSRLPLHATSQGKLLLSTMSDSKAEKILKNRPMSSYTPHTKIDIPVLLLDLAEIRTCGYSVEDGEYKIGLRSVSAPVFDNTGKVKYSLTTIGFFRRTSADDFQNAISSTVRQAKLLSSALGYNE